MTIFPIGTELDLDVPQTFDAHFVYIVNVNQTTPQGVSILDEDSVEIANFTVPANFAMVVEKLKENFIQGESADVKGTPVIRMD